MQHANALSDSDSRLGWFLCHLAACAFPLPAPSDPISWSKPQLIAPQHVL